MARCLHCSGTWVAGDSTNSRDSQLENLLQDLVEVAEKTGLCGFDYISGIQVPGAEVSSQQRHSDLADSIRQAKEAVHSYIRHHYERDD